ncbi:uncharacterized protein JCM15063_004239 [Sporobolomyces koalae]|uniref:uncharacterized protein n=1 Tax=Sporobolomyces koalae TaxID=500713 RepID=UPI00317BC763
MGWTDRWHAAGLAAFVGNDFTGGGITGSGWNRLAEKRDLDQSAESSKTWCQVRRDLEASDAPGYTIDRQMFTSTDALDYHFDAPFKASAAARDDDGGPPRKRRRTDKRSGPPRAKRRWKRQRAKVSRKSETEARLSFRSRLRSG